MAAQMAGSHFFSHGLTRHRLSDGRHIQTLSSSTTLRLSIQTREPLRIAHCTRPNRETPTTMRADLVEPCALALASRGIEGLLICTEIHRYLRCLGYPSGLGRHGYIGAVVAVVGFHLLSRVVAIPLASVATTYVANELAKASGVRLSIGIVSCLLSYYLQLGLSGVATTYVISEYLYSVVMLLRLGKSFKLLPQSIESLQIPRYMKFGRLVFLRMLSHFMVIVYGNALAMHSGPLARAAYHTYIARWLAYMFLADAWTSSVQAYLARSIATGKSIHEDPILSLVAGNNAGRAIMLTSCVTLVLSMCFNRHEIFFLHLPLHVMASTIHSILCGASSFELSTFSTIIAGGCALFIMWALPSAPVALPVWTGMLIFSIIRLFVGYALIAKKFGNH